MHQRYRCRAAGCDDSAEWLAKDNNAELGHICSEHYKGLRLDKREHYIHEAVANRPPGKSVYYPYDD